MADLVPYSYLGNLVHSVSSDDDPEWRANTVFVASLRMDWLEPGAAVKRLIVMRDIVGGYTYPVFVDDIMEIIRHSVVDHGVVHGKWKVKRTGRTKALYTLVKVE